VSKKGTVVICVLLAIVLCLQIVLISKLNAVHKDMVSIDSAVLERIEVMTINQHTIINKLNEMTAGE